MRTIRELSAGVDGAARVPIRVAPGAHDIELLQCEPQWIHDAMAGIARGVLAMALEPHAHGFSFLSRLGFLERAYPGWWCRRWRARDVLEDPGPPQHGSGAIAIGGRHEHAGLAEQAPAVRIRQPYYTELVALDIGHAIVPGQRLVEVAPIRAQQLKHAAV